MGTQKRAFNMVTKDPKVETTYAQIESLNESESKGPNEMKKKVNFKEFLLI
jgi:hypothetical protein